MKILGKSFPDFLSLCKVLGTAMMLLLSNPSEGVDLPGNSIVFSNVALSSPTSCSFQLHERVDFGVSRNIISERVSFPFFQQRKYSLKPAEK